MPMRALHPLNIFMECFLFTCKFISRLVIGMQHMTQTNVWEVTRSIYTMIMNTVLHKPLGHSQLEYIATKL